MSFFQRFFAYYLFLYLGQTLIVLFTVDRETFIVGISDILSFGESIRNGSRVPGWGIMIFVIAVSFHLIVAVADGVGRR